LGTSIATFISQGVLAYSNE